MPAKKLSLFSALVKGTEWGKVGCDQRLLEPVALPTAIPAASGTGML